MGFLNNLFAPKEGGTVVGNMIRSAGTLITGGTATVVKPQTTEPQQNSVQQPNMVMAPVQGNDNLILMIGAGVAVLVGVVFGEKTISLVVL